MIPEEVRRPAKGTALWVLVGHSLEGSMNLSGPQATYFEKLLTWSIPTTDTYRTYLCQIQNKNKKRKENFSTEWWWVTTHQWEDLLRLLNARSKLSEWRSRGTVNNNGEEEWTQKLGGGKAFDNSKLICCLFSVFSPHPIFSSTTASTLYYILCSFLTPPRDWSSRVGIMHDSAPLVLE